MRYKKYGVDITEEYYKQSNKKHSPIRYTSRSYVTTGKLASVNIKKDPLLKNHPELEKAMMKHELEEIKLRAKGVSINKAHKMARDKESKLIKNLSLGQMQEILRR